MSKLKSRLAILSMMILAVTALAGLAAGPAAAVSPGGRDTAVIMFNFTDDTSQPATTTQLREWIFTNSDSVAAQVREDSNNTVWIEGRNNASSGDFFGWVTVDFNKTEPAPGETCISQARVQEWNENARTKAAALGYTHANYPHTIFVKPRLTNTCTLYQGFGDVNTGDITFNDYFYASAFMKVLGHEFGHALPPGNMHAQKLTCQYIGYNVPLEPKGSCTIEAYGDWFSALGSNKLHVLNNGYHAARLGYIPAANVRTVSKDATTTVTLRTVHPAASGATQLLRVDRGASVDAEFRYLYLEFRQPSGVFEANLPGSLTNGVIARVAPDHSTATPENASTHLVDATPWTTEISSWDDSIKVGDPLYDRIGSLSISVNSISATSASVTVSPGAKSSQGTVSLSGDQLRFVAAAGKRNIIGTTLDSAAGQFNVQSPYATGGRLTAGAGCNQVTQIHVRCSSTGIKRQYYDLGDRDDQLTAIPSMLSEIRGGDGDDTLKGAAAIDTIIGGDGNDELTGGGGSDTLQPGLGRDLIHGGSGNDTVTYAERTENLYITLTGYSSSGTISPVEGDMIDSDVENATTGSGNDILVGSPSANVLRGGLGADSFDGATGSDTVSYDDRTTAVWSSINGIADDGALLEGDNIQTTIENLLGGSGNDILIGSESIGNMIAGGLGVDVLNGLSGNDMLSTQDGVNDSTLDCGTGSDSLTADLSPLDALVTGCEVINRN